MAKFATTIDEQIQLLESRGLIIPNKEKAREILLDIGYYRLGFYLFPFEKSYPSLDRRTHEFKEGATFMDAVRLYYFDYDLRLLLMRYLTRIEVAFRSSLIYNLSNKYKDSPFWFVDCAVVSQSYSQDFENKVYNSDFKRNPIIQRHHRKNAGDRYAPAWKTIEFMTFGAVMKLYSQLNNLADKMNIAHTFGIRQVVTFESYMHTVRYVRNACAHGLVLYDLRLPLAIRRGPANHQPANRNNIIGALEVIKYIISRISVARANDLSSDVQSIYNNLCLKSPNLKNLLPDFSVI